jgi:hypothetical protein
MRSIEHFGGMRSRASQLLRRSESPWPGGGILSAINGSPLIAAVRFRIAVRGLAILGLGIIAGLSSGGQGALRHFLIEVCDFALSETNTCSNMPKIWRCAAFEWTDDASQHLFVNHY